MNNLIRCYNQHLRFALSCSDLVLKTDYFGRLRGIIVCLYHSGLISQSKYNYLFMCFDFLKEAPNSDIYTYDDLSIKQKVRA